MQKAVLEYWTKIALMYWVICTFIRSKQGEVQNKYVHVYEFHDNFMILLRMQKIVVKKARMPKIDTVYWTTYITQTWATLITRTENPLLQIVMFFRK